LEDNKVAREKEAKKENTRTNFLVLMETPETAIAIITAEGSKRASLCDVCLQRDMKTCCPYPEQETVSQCDGYRYNQSSSKEVEAQIRKQPAP
jgi:hypothetical protein